MSSFDEPVLACHGLSKDFQDGATTISVLQSIDFALHAGETMSIVGASGSGKSTLLHLLAGLDTPTAGHVSVDGQNIFQLNQRNRGLLRNQKLGFVYQFHHLLNEFSALENVAMPLLMRASCSVQQAHDLAHDMLVKVGLEKRVTHRPAQLSGGERQRAALARALVSSPKCVLADEPTGNLDQETAMKVYELMLDLNREFNTSFVLVTHDESLAERMDHVYRLNAGSLVKAE